MINSLREAIGKPIRYDGQVRRLDSINPDGTLSFSVRLDGQFTPVGRVDQIKVERFFFAGEILENEQIISDSISDSVRKKVRNRSLAGTFNA